LRKLGLRKSCLAALLGNLPDREALVFKRSDSTKSSATAVVPGAITLRRFFLLLVGVAEVLAC
jgi:hypothetical protein